MAEVADAGAFGRALAQRAYALGLAVSRAGAPRRAIPIATTAVVLDAREIERRSALAAALASATAKVAHVALSGPHADDWLGAMSPAERRLVEATWRGLDRLATTRVDFSDAPAGLAALEVNATIPAMQGYSDIAARSFIEAAGARAGLDARATEALVARNGSNTQALRVALESLWSRHAPGRPLRTIALLCRRGDAQVTELEWIRDRFGEAGYDAAIVHPDEVTDADPFRARGAEWQLVYRHIFLSRLDETPSSALESAVARWRGGRSLLVNPPAAHLEMKATFALLSELAHAGGGPFDDAERAAIAASVPWTRRLHDGASDLPDGARTRALADAVAAEPARYVLKRSWSYGGVGVFVGAEAGTPAFAQRLQHAFGDAIADWPALCAHAARHGGYVVQQAVPTQARALELCTPEGRASGEMRVDYAAYASLGAGDVPWGGVVRAAPSAIVNIVGGGGVVPLLTREVAAALELA